MTVGREIYSFEYMRLLNSIEYKYGIVVNHNPYAKKCGGSCIFIPIKKIIAGNIWLAREWIERKEELLGFFQTWGLGRKELGKFFFLISTFQKEGRIGKKDFNFYFYSFLFPNELGHSL